MPEPKSTEEWAAHCVYAHHKNGRLLDGREWSEYPKGHYNGKRSGGGSGRSIGVPVSGAASGVQRSPGTGP